MDGRLDRLGNGPTTGPTTGHANGQASGVGPRLLTTAQAADVLGVTRATVVAWARQGRFGGIQYGRRGIYRFERRVIESFVARTKSADPDRER